MTPTLAGRLQTRLFLLATVGLLWTAAVTPLLARPAWASLSMAYHITFQAIGVVALLGLGWELAYHGLQQLRWDKDWPTALGLLTAINEGVLAWFTLHALNILPGTSGWSSPLLSLFLVHFGTTWFVLWAFMQGPLRVIHLRWRYEGGRVF